MNIFNNSRVEIVVAKYKEKYTTWMNGLNNCVVYDKSKDVPNIGREAHTYLLYILENYDNLPPYACFLQGNPFHHCKQFDVDFDDFVPLSDKFNEVDRNGLPIHPMPIGRVYDTLFDGVQKKFRYGCGAQFLVSRAAIRFRSVRFYEKCQDMIVNDKENCSKRSKTGCMPWLFERLWPVVFDGKTPEKYDK